MKKNSKNIILISLGLIIILILLYLIFFSEISKPAGEKGLKNSVASSTPVEIVDPAVMTAEERKMFRVDPLLKIEVLRRSATGTPTDYRIIR